MEDPEPLVVDSARRHGVEDDDMLHALRNPVRTFLVAEDMTMVIGADRAGRLIEVGVWRAATSPVWWSSMPWPHDRSAWGGEGHAAFT